MMLVYSTRTNKAIVLGSDTTICICATQASQHSLLIGNTAIETYDHKIDAENTFLEVIAAYKCGNKTYELPAPET